MILSQLLLQGSVHGGSTRGSVHLTQLATQGSVHYVEHKFNYKKW